MQSFADSYVAGETPIPCVVCNQQIKFQELLTTARELEADALATGHYIQRRPGLWPRARARPRCRARSELFPVRHHPRPARLAAVSPRAPMRKAEVRALARELELPVADKSDSQDICFVPQGRYTNVIERLKPGAAEAGDIVHVDGRVLGRHGGIINYTIGQRRGLGVPGPAPLYVVRLDADAKQVVVGPRESLHAHWITLRNINWLGDEPIPEGGMDVAVRVRSTSPPQPATLLPSAAMAHGCCCATGNTGWLRARLASFYADAGPEARVLGGGWIGRALSRAEQPGTDERLKGVAGEVVRVGGGH